MVRILIVEDEEAIANLIYVNLRDEGYRCTCAFDGKQGADFMEQEQFDLILLDIMLPEIDGYELLEYAKSLDVPVIFLTAKSAVEDRINGLKLGADDYLAKPFQIGELSARVEAVLRRYGKGERQFIIADVCINSESRSVLKQGQPVELTAKEFDLLVELVQNKNIALYRDRLYEKVWNEPFTGETRTLDTHIQRLRKKLDWDDRIKTVFRIGYRLEG
jgi:DNA-binding response OmpR family regulator